MKLLAQVGKFLEGKVFKVFGGLTTYLCTKIQTRSQDERSEETSLQHGTSISKRGEMRLISSSTTLIIGIFSNASSHASV